LTDCLIVRPMTAWLG